MASKRWWWSSPFVIVCVFLGLIVLTPVGNWFVGRLIVWGAASAGWDVAFEETSGTVAGTLTFHGLTANDAERTIELSSTRLAFHTRAYRLDIHQPDLAISPGADSTASEQPASDLILPLAYFPEVLLRHGRFSVRSDSLLLQGDGLEMTYQPTADTSGTLNLNIQQFSVAGPEPLASGRLAATIHLRPGHLRIEGLNGVVTADSVQIALNGGGLLGLDAALPLDITVESKLQTDSVQVEGALAVVGALTPLAIELRLDGTVREPSVGSVDFLARASVDSTQVRLDSLGGALLGGRLNGRAVYYSNAERLEVQAQLERLDLAKLPESPTAGYLDLALEAELDLPAERYLARLDLSAADLTLWEGERLAVQFNARLDPDRRLEAVLRSAPGELRADGWVSPDGTYALDLAGEVEPATLLDYDLAPLRMVGRVVPDTLTVRLDTDRMPSEIGRFGAVQVDATLAQWRFLTASGRIEEEQLTFGLGMDLETSWVDSFGVVLAPLALSRLEADLAGKVRGQIQGSGDLATDAAANAFALRGSFALDRPGYNDWYSESLAIQLAYAADRVHVDIEAPALHSQVVYDLETRLLDGQARFNGPLVARNGDALDGGALRLEGQATWQIPTDAPKELVAHLALDSLQARWGEWEFTTDGPLLAGYKERQVALERVRFITPVGPLDAAGRLREEALDVRVELERLDLTALVPGTALVGHSLWHFAGSVAQPRIEGELVLPQASLDTLVLGDFQASLHLADSLQVRMDLVRANRPTPRVEFRLALPAAPLLSGETDLSEGRMHLDLVMRQTKWNALVSHLFGQPASAHLDLEGRMALPLNLLHDPLAWNGLEGYLRVNEGILELPAADSLRIWVRPGGQILLNDDRVELRQVHIQGQGYDLEREGMRRIGVLDMDGALHAVQPSRLGLALSELDLGAVADLEGSAALNAELTGTLNQFDLAVDLTAQTLDLGDVKGALTADNQGGRLALNWVTPLDDSVGVTAQLPWALPRGDVDMTGGRAQIRSSGIDLSVFRHLLPQFDEFQGRVRADLGIEGFDDSLMARGEVGFDSLKFALADLQPLYVVPAGRLVFEGQKAVFKDFVGGPDKERGKLSLGGGIDLASPNGQLLDIRLTTENLPLRYENIFKVPDIDIALRFTGGPTASRLAGSVRFSHALTIPPLIEFNAPPTPPPPPTVQDEFMENLALEVEIDIQQLKVDSELAQVEISGGGDVGGTFYKPTFQGDWGIDQGYVFLLNRKFDFEQGRISLNHLVPTAPLLDLAYDPLLLNPDLDIRARTRVVDTGTEDRTEYDVTLNLQGPLLSVAPEFTAEPSLPFESIMTLLAFSSTEAENPSYGAALGTAAGQLFLSKRIEDVGLDEFNILPSGTSLSTVGEPSVLMGKHLKKLPLPLWVRYEAAIRDFSLGEVRVEHRLNSLITISGSAESAQERYGLGIGLKKVF